MPDLVKKWKEEHPFLSQLEDEIYEERNRKQKEYERQQEENRRQREEQQRQYAQFQADRNRELANWIKGNSPLALEDENQQRRLEEKQKREEAAAKRPGPYTLTPEAEARFQYYNGGRQQKAEEKGPNYLTPQAEFMYEYTTRRRNREAQEDDGLLKQPIRRLTPDIEALYQQQARGEEPSNTLTPYTQYMANYNAQREKEAKNVGQNAESAWPGVGRTVAGMGANFLSGAGQPLVNLARLGEMPSDFLYKVTGNEKYNLDRQPGLRTSEALKESDPFASTARDLKEKVGPLGQQLIESAGAAGNMLSSFAFFGLGANAAGNPVNATARMANASGKLGSPLGRLGARAGIEILSNPGNFGISLGSAVGNYSDAYANGAGFGQALTNGLLKGMTEYYSNKLFSGTPYEDSADKGYVTRLIEQAAQDLGGSEVLRAINNTTGGRAMNWFFDKAGEGLEEVVTGVMDPLIDRLTYDRTKDLATVEQLTEEFLGGVLLSLLMTGGEAVINSLEPEEKKVALDAEDRLQRLGIDSKDARKYSKDIAAAVIAMQKDEQVRTKDFTEKSAGDPEIVARAAEGNDESLKRYAAIYDRDSSARDLRRGANPRDVDQSAFLTENEAKNYFYIWNNQGAKAADAFYDQYLASVLEQRRNAAMQQYLQQELRKWQADNLLKRTEEQPAPQEQKLTIPSQQNQTARQADPLGYALNKAQNGEALTLNDARAIIENPQALQALRESGVLTDEVKAGKEGRQQVKAAVEALAERQTEYNEARSALGISDSFANIQPVAQERAAAPMSTQAVQEETRQAETVPAPPVPQRATESAAETPSTEGSGLRITAAEQNRIEAQAKQETAEKAEPITAEGRPAEEKSQRAAQKMLAKLRQRQLANNTPQSLQEMGFQNAGQGTTHVFAENQWDAEMQAVAEALRAEGIEPTYFTGNAMNAEGNKVSTLLEGNRLAIQADSQFKTIQALAESAIGRSLNMSGEGFARAAEAAQVTQAAPRSVQQPKRSQRAQRSLDSARQYNVNEEKAETAARLADVLGLDILWYNEPGADGVEEGGKTVGGVLLLNAAAKESPVVWVVGHELTHNTENTRVYNGLKKLAMQAYKAAGKDWKAEVNSRVAEAGEIAKIRNDDSYLLDPEDAEKELTADWFADKVLTDEATIRQIMQNDPTTARGILSYLKNLLQKIQRKEPTIERAIELYSKALKQAAIGAQETGQSRGLKLKDTLNGSAQSIKNQKYSVRSIFDAAGFQVTLKGGRVIATDSNGKQITEMTEDMVRRSGIGAMIRYAQDVTKSISKKEADTQIEGLTRLFNLMLKAQDGDMVWRFTGSSMFSAVKSNSDGQYSTTVDFSTVCKKTEEMMRTMSTVMMKTHRGLSKDQIIELQNDILAENGLVPCPVCYVFSRWAGVGGILDNMAKFQKKYDGAEWDDPQRMAARIAQLKQATKSKKDLKALLMEEDNAYQQYTGELEANKAEQKQLRAERKTLTGKKADAAANAARVAEIDKRLKELDGLNALLDADIKDIEKSGAPEAAWLERVRSKPDYREHGYVDENLLYNLLAADRLAEEKPLAWGYRTSRGPSAGKAILPYSDMRLGDWVLGPKSNSAKGANLLFSSVGEQFSKNQLNKIDEAKMKVLAQNLIGGQRYQSTSDFMYDYGLDYLLSFFEGQMLGSKMQTYTKVMEFVNLVASVHGDVNISMMPLDAGYVTEEDGRQHLIYSSVTGANPEAAIRANHLFDNAQLILVGINDQHILLALEDSEETGGSEIGFVIPYHASGASINNFIRGLVENLKETFDERNYKNYEPMQNDSDRKNATATQKDRERLRRYLLTGKRGKSDLKVNTGNPNGLTDTEMKLLKGRSKDIRDRSFEELREIEKKALAGDKAAIREYESWSAGFLGDIYKKMWTDPKARDTHGVRLTGDQPNHIMPHEFWDTRVDREHAYINGFRFRSYCYSLGLVPRFTGINSAGKHLGYGDFSDSKGYWKTLIDRPMYDRKGNYRDQQIMNVTELSRSFTGEYVEGELGTGAGMLSPQYGKEFWGENAQTPDTGVAARAAERYLERNGEKPKFSARKAKDLYRTEQDFTKPMPTDKFRELIKEESRAESYFPKGLPEKFMKAIAKKSTFNRTKLYRGIDAAEFDYLLENKFLKSNGSYNFTDQQGQTLSDEDPGYALSYATGFAPQEIAKKHYEGDYLPTYLIEFVNAPDLNVKKNSVQESYTYDNIDQDYITRVFEITYDPDSKQDMVMEITNGDFIKSALPNLGKGLSGMAHGEPMFFRDKTTGTILYAVQGDDGWENGTYISEANPDMLFNPELMEDEVYAKHVPKMLKISGDESDLEAMTVGPDGSLVPEKAPRYSAKKAIQKGGKADKSIREYINYKDKKAFKDKVSTVTQAAESKGKYVEITQDEIDAQSKASVPNKNFLRSARDYLKSILKKAMGDSVYFDFKGDKLEAYLTARAKDHYAVYPTAEKAAAMEKFRELVNNAEYAFSSEHDIHSVEGTETEAENWDYFVTPVHIGDQTIPLLFSLRDIEDDFRYQIYAAEMETDAATFRGNASRNNPQSRPPSYEGITASVVPTITDAEEKNKPQFSAKKQQTGGDLASSERSTEALEGRLLGSRELLGTPALKKLGVKVNGSVGRYANTQQLLAKNKAAKELKKQARDAEKRLQATDAEIDFASGIAAGVYDEEDIPSRLRKDVVMELADYYFASDSANLDTLIRVRADINRGLLLDAEDLMDDLEIKPQSMILLNERTPERNFRSMFGERGNAITEWLIQPVRENEAEKIRWFNKQMDAVREFTDARGRKRELTREESALTMKVMEGRAAAEMIADLETDPKNRYGKQQAKNIRNAAENIRKGGSAADAAREFSLGDRERDLAEKYAAWQTTLEELKQADSTIVENAAKEYARIFDEFYEAINDFLAAHGYEPIGYIKGYAPHMQPEENQSLLEKAFGAMGINTQVTELPANIAGQTANYKPNKRWNPYFLQRTGSTAQYDIVKAYESYVDYLSDIFYHTDDIMRARQLVRWIRKSYAKDEIKSQLDYIETIREAPIEVKQTLLRDAGEIGQTSVLSPMDVEEKMQEYVEKLFSRVTDSTRYSNLVMWLENYANILAGKQSFADRGWEYSTGRKSLNFANRLNAAFQKANVAGNLSSALNQAAQIPMISAELGERDFLSAVFDVVTGKVRQGNFLQDSDFLMEKEGKDYLYADRADKFINALFTPASVADHLVSIVAVRGAFNKAIRQGKSYAEAMRYADDFGRKLMGSRAKGSRPLAYESKGFFSKMVHQFQVECANSWDHIATDLPSEFKEIARTQGKNKAARALAALLVRAILGTFILNRLTDELYGGTPAPFDILGLTANFIASGQGLTTNNWIRKVIDNGMEKITGQRIFGTQDKETKFSLKDASEELIYNVMNDLPLARNVAAVLGLGDENLPLPGASGEFSAMKKAVQGMLDDGVDKGDIEALLRATFQAASQFVPGGRQLRKTAEGAEAVIRGGSYKNGKLQYPVEGAADTARALLFGKNATNSAREYWAAGGKALSDKQTGIYEGLLDEGMSRQEAYDTITGYRDEGTLNDFGRWQDSRSKTAGVDEETFIRFRTDTAGLEADKIDGKTVSGSLKEKVKNYIDGLENLTADQKTALLLDYNSGYSLKDVVWSNGPAGTPAPTAEPTQAPAASSMPIATPEPETPGLTYRGQQYYDGFVAAGIREDAADTLARKLETTEASGHEQWRAIYNAASYSDREKAVTSVMNDGAKRNWELAKSAGCSLDDYISVRENYLDLDENGKQRQSEWNATLDQYTFSADEAKDRKIKGTLWQILTGSESTKNNPYDKDAGQAVIDAKSGGGGKGSGSYAPSRLRIRRQPWEMNATTEARPRSGLRITAR